MWFQTPSIGFSSSGDFAYIVGRTRPGETRFQVVKDSLEASTKPLRYTKRYLATDGALYKLEFDDSYTVQLSLYKSGFTKRTVAEHRVCLPNLTHLSSHYANASKIFLILGKTDNDYMHILVIPYNDRAPELKTISLTWAEARAILNRKWEEVYGNLTSDRDMNSEDAQTPEEETEGESTDLQQLSILPSI